MDLVRLTRDLVDIESITNNERQVGEYLLNYLHQLNYQVEEMPVEGNRFNVYATANGSTPAVVFSTHMDTVPPFIGSSEDDQSIYGRGSCDAKGIIAAQIAAVERLRKNGAQVALLFLVGEERDSTGAQVANRQPRGSKYMINGEPTENCIALASKGTLRVDVTASGKMAHSAYPQLGESAIEKLVEALHRLLAMPLPSNPEIGPTTLNIGVIEGGLAPNVIPDHAKAQLLYRLVGPTQQLREQIKKTVGDLAQAEFRLEIPYMKFRRIPELPTMIAAFTTDIPALTKWGEPFLLGPGSIHVAHTTGEYISKKQLHEAVDLYVRAAEYLLSRVAQPPSAV
ncbi:MAG TPA: M20/M25/M40 family metallo-hydrolase [Terriglobales bacterium]